MSLETEVDAAKDMSKARDAARIALGLTLIAAGTSHLSFARNAFKAQVPEWVPLDPDTVVLQSGVVEILLGSALAFLPRRKVPVGRVAAGFFTCIFPGNISQYTHRRSAFGLDTDGKRLTRLFFQPLLVAWALWSTNALRPPGSKSLKISSSLLVLKSPAASGFQTTWK